MSINNPIPAQPFLSIIIPAYNEEKRLPATLDQISQFLQTQPYPAEVLVIENGSQDRTLAVAQEYARRFPFIRAIHIDGRGKGLAVQHGMLAAGGTYRFMCDSDLSMPVEEINRFLPPALPNPQVAIGSREAPGAVRYNEPVYRHLGGRVVNAMIRLLALPGLNDTQCGFKCLQAEAAQDLFRRLTLTGWSFDVELLYIARLRGYAIVEVPIHWHYDAGSRLNVIKGTLAMLRDLLTIRQNHRRGVYD